jgi:uncharacterized protein (TIRG00374 family)
MPENTNRKIILNTLKFVGFLLLTVFVVYLVFKGIPMVDFFHKLMEVNYFYVSFSAIAGLGAYYIRGLRWRLMLQPFNYNPKAINMYHSIAIGYFANMAIPRFGELVRCSSLKVTDDVPMDRSVGSVITERLSDLLVLGLLTLYLLFFHVGLISNFLNEKIFSPLGHSLYNQKYILTIVGSIVILAIVILLVFLFRSKKENAIILKFKSMVTGFKDGLLSIYTMKKKGLFLTYTLLIWILYFLMAYVVFWASPVTENLTVVDGLFILVAGSFGMVAPVQNGFGAYHWIVSMALMALGLSREDGLLYATLMHETQVLVILVFGPISMYSVFFKTKRKKHEQSL